MGLTNFRPSEGPRHRRGVQRVQGSLTAVLSYYEKTSLAQSWCPNRQIYVIYRSPYAVVYKRPASCLIWHCICVIADFGLFYSPTYTLKHSQNLKYFVRGCLQTTKLIIAWFTFKEVCICRYSRLPSPRHISFHGWCLVTFHFTADESPC